MTRGIGQGRVSKYTREQWESRANSARYMFNMLNMRIGAIASRLSVSETTAYKMIDGKKPKRFKRDE